MGKIEKQDKEKKKHMLRILFIVLFTISVIANIFAIIEIENERELNAASTDLLMFTINVSSYCAESNNMTLQELLNGYIIETAENMVNNQINEEVYYE